MQVGFGKQIITPTKPIEMSGYAGNRLSTGVHDDLYVKALVFKQNHEYQGILSFDLLGVDRQLKEDILKQVEVPIQLVLCATHTHQGPNRILSSSFKTLFLQVDDKYHQFLIQQSVLAIQKAIATLEFFEIFYGKNQVHGVYSNRHESDRFYNSYLNILKLETETKTIGLFNFSCHPTILKDDNTLFSKDLVYGLETHLYGYDEFMFLNGTAGDISTRFTRTSSDYQQVDETGRRLAYIIMATDLRPLPTFGPIEFSLHVFSLKTKEARLESEIIQQKETLEKTLATLQDPVERRQIITQLQGLEVEIQNADFLNNHQDWDVYVNLLDFGGFKIVTFPLEVFSSLAIDLLKYHPDVLMVSYVDGYNGYLADQSAYERQVYEAHSSIFKKGEGERLFAEVKTLL